MILEYDIAACDLLSEAISTCDAILLEFFIEKKKKKIHAFSSRQPSCNLLDFTCSVGVLSPRWRNTVIQSNSVSTVELCYSNTDMLQYDSTLHNTKIVVNDTKWSGKNTNVPQQYSVMVQYEQRVMYTWFKTGLSGLTCCNQTACRFDLTAVIHCSKVNTVFNTVCFMKCRQLYVVMCSLQPGKNGTDSV